MTKEISGRIDSVTVLRGIASLAVCIVHTSLITNFHSTKFIDYIIMNCQQGVAIFFVLSGFILPYSLYKKDYTIKSFFPFLFRRSVRIDLPYWSIIAIIFLVGEVPFIVLNLKSIIVNVFYLVPFVKNTSWYSSIFWTLSIEFQFYILLGILYPILNKLNTNIALAVLTSGSVILILFGFFGKQFIIDVFYDFVIGYLVFWGRVKLLSQAKMVAAILLFSIFLMFKISYMTGAVPLLAALFLIFFQKKNLPGYLTFIGKISYSLYLVHLTAGSLFFNIARNFTSNNFVLFPLCITVSILCASLFYIVIEKPSLILSQKVSL